MAITTTPSGGPQGEFSTYTPISSQTLSATASSVTFSNIPTTYTDLVISVSSQNSGAYVDAYVTVNGDNSTNYSSLILTANGSTATSTRQTSSSKVFFDYNGAPPNGTSFNNVVAHFMNYSNPTTYKSWLVRASNGAASGGVDAIVGMWRSTSPITSITLTPTGSLYASGSTFTLYGIKAAATQFIPVNAAGGDYAVSDGTYAYHVFKSSGIFAPAKSLSCDVLVIAGGGGGSSGGGGAGGYRSGTGLSLTAQSYAVVVGAGGPTATKGGNSSISTITSTGGGAAGGAGGSGAGGDAFGGTPGAGNQGSYSPVEGYAGGASGTVAAGGGGGAAAVGSAPAGTSLGGVGGAGSNSFSSWATATGTGVGGYYAGGGGGAGGSTNGTGGAGGTGGGGYGQGSPSAGGNNPLNGPGFTNTGSGGGGGWASAGQSGGSGLVIVRYAL